MAKDVCVFGDSITWGAWDPDDGGWIGRLYRAGCNLPATPAPQARGYSLIYNCGIPGDRVSGVLARIDTEATARAPGAIVIAIGINDVPHGDYLGTPEDAFSHMYSQLLERAKHFTDDVLAVTATNVDEARAEHDYRNADIEQLVKAMKRCAAEADVPVVDVFGSLTAEDLLPDGLHPSAAGHQKLYDKIAPAVWALVLPGN